ncbi:MAG: hypothetical protein MJA29_00155 [Candidatus Omnitrophica bacterium]|nr:hypothetical protein [Candidatus Omnitrophota bacterium]
MRRISDFANTGGVVTVDDAFSATVAADDTYGLLPGIAPDILKAKINTVVRKFQYEQWDITSLDTVSGQTVYTLPAAIPAKTLISVKIQTNNDDADDPQWVDVPNWKPKTAAAGSQDEVILPGGLTSSRNLALVYAKKHPRLTADDSEIHQSIPLERIIYKAAANLMKDKLYDNDGKDNIAALINDLEEQNREMQARFPVGVSLRDSKVMDPW